MVETERKKKNENENDKRNKTEPKTIMHALRAQAEFRGDKVVVFLLSRSVP